MVVGGAVETLHRPPMFLAVPKGIQDVVHRRELTLAPPLSPLTQLVPVVFNLRLVPQGDLHTHTQTHTVEIMM